MRSARGGEKISSPLALRKMPRLPRFAHKAPFLQATLTVGQSACLSVYQTLDPVYVTNSQSIRLLDKGSRSRWLWLKFTFNQAVNPSGPSCSIGGNAIHIHLLKLCSVKIAIGFPNTYPPDSAIQRLKKQGRHSLQFTTSQPVSVSLRHPLCFTISQLVSLFVSQTVTRYGAGHSLLKV